MKKFQKILSLTLTAVMLFTLALSLIATAATATYKTTQLDVSFVKTNWTLADEPEQLLLYSLTYVDDATAGTTTYTRTKIEDNVGVTFSSSNPDVIEVSADGTVTPKKLGYSIVTITYNSVSRKVMLFCQDSYTVGITKDGVSSIATYTGETINDPFALPISETYPQVWKNTVHTNNDKFCDWSVSDTGATLVNFWFYDAGTSTKWKFAVLGGYNNANPHRKTNANGDTYRNTAGNGSDEKKVKRTGMGWHQATVLVTKDAATEGMYKWTYYIDGQVHYQGEHSGASATLVRTFAQQYFKDVYVGTYKPDFNVEQKITAVDSLENISTQVSPTLFFTSTLASGTDVNSLITIADASGNSVPFTATADGKEVYITFANELNANTSYTITLSENIKDVYGSSVPEASRTITFKTASNKVSDIVGKKYNILSEKRIDMSGVSNAATGTTANELVANTAGTYTVSLATGYTDTELLSVDKYIIKYKYYADDLSKINLFGMLGMYASNGGNNELNYTYATGTAGKDVNVRYPTAYLNDSGAVTTHQPKLIDTPDITKFEDAYYEVTYEINVNRAVSARTSTTTKMTITGEDGYTVASVESFPWQNVVFKDLRNINFKLNSATDFKVKDMTVYMMQKNVTDVDFALTGITLEDESPVEAVTDLKGNTSIISYTVTNNKLTAGTDTYIVTVAVYDTQTNKIVAVNNSGLLTAQNVATAVPGSIEINVPGNAPDTLAVYAYIWDGYTSMKPLTNKADLFAE